MKTFEEIVKEIIWQKENVSLKNAVNELKTAFSQFTIEVANNIEDNKSSNLFYDASIKVRETMEVNNSSELKQLKGTYFAIKVNNNLNEINEMLIKDGFIPNKEWNNAMIKVIKTSHVIVYENFKFEFHNHNGDTNKIIEL